MDILAALRQEEAKWEKKVSAAKQQLGNVRAAMKLLGGMGSSGKATASSGGKKTGAMSSSGKKTGGEWRGGVCPAEGKKASEGTRRGGEKCGDKQKGREE